MKITISDFFKKNFFRQAEFTPLFACINFSKLTSNLTKFVLKNNYFNPFKKKFTNIFRKRYHAIERDSVCFLKFKIAKQPAKK